MNTESVTASLLDQVHRGYQAAQQLRSQYPNRATVQAYIAHTSEQIHVRYRNTLCQNALDAALHYTGQANAPVDPALFDRKFRQYFEEQLLIYSFRKQRDEQQAATRQGIGDLLLSDGLIVERQLRLRFDSVPAADIRFQVDEAINVTLHRLNDPSFQLTSSLRLFLLETARHLTMQYLDEQRRSRSAPKTDRAANGKQQVTRLQTAYAGSGEPGPDETLYQTILREVVTAARQYVSAQRSSSCQAFLAVYWQLKSPFDFVDPATSRTVREELVQQRLGLTDEQVNRLKTKKLTLTQPQVLQLVSGQKPAKQRVNDFYYQCLAPLLRYLSEQTDYLPFLNKPVEQLTAKESGRMANFKRCLAKWIRTMRMNPTTTS